MDLALNPLRALGDGGPGFCYESDRDLFRGAGSLNDGPLLVALDSNIIFDLEEHGEAILELEDTPGVDRSLAEELLAVGQIIDVWMARDIRFIVVPRTRNDFRRAPSEERMRQREATFRRIELALTFQAGDWEDAGARFRGERPSSPAVDSLIELAPDLDALMLRSAWNAGVDVFLTRDVQVLRACGHAGAPLPLIVSPTGLRNRLDSLGNDLLFLGMTDHAGCQWSGGLPIGDMGKWVPLFEAMLE